MTIFEPLTLNSLESALSSTRREEKTLTSKRPS
jgi:hypothetical protein